jgi:hypothetical protein
MVIANPGIQRKNTSGSFTVLRRDPAGLNINSAQRICADSGQQLSISGLSHIKSIKQCQRLRGLAAGDMRLRVLIEHHSWNETQSVPIIAGVRVRNVNDVDPAELFLRRNLGGIDGRRGLHHIYRLADFLFMRQSYLKRSRGLNGGQREDIEILFLNAQLPRRASQPSEMAPAGSVSVAMNDFTRTLQLDSRGLNRNSVLVADNDDEFIRVVARTSSLRARNHQQKKKQKRA